MLYSIYTLMVLLFFLYIRFPSDTVMDLISAHLAATDPSIRVESAKISPTLIAGLRFEDVELSYGETRIFTAKQIKVTPELFNLLRNRRNFGFEGTIGQGSLKGRLEYLPKAQKPQTKLVANAVGIPIENLDILKQWSSYKAIGNLNGSMEYDSQKSGDGNAKINFEIMPTKLVFTPPIMGLEQLDFTQMKAELNLSSHMMQIRRWDAIGPQLETRLSGTMVMRQPFGSSRLTVACILKPQEAFLSEHKNDLLGGLLSAENAQSRGLVLRVSGTLDNPRYTMR
jgi:type II secretion system protein N